MVEIGSASAPDFHGTARRDGDGIVVELEGDGNMDVVAPLDLLLTTIHQTALDGTIREVRVDMRKLAFMNSACFKCFIDWIVGIQSMEPEAQYRVRFLSAPSFNWQRRSLRSLQCFAVELITVE